jgi:3-dehydroquinate synthase
MADILQVNLGERSYPILFGIDVLPDLCARIGSLTREGRKVAVLTDAHLARCQAAVIAEAFNGLPVLSVAAGEESKSLGVYGGVLDFLAEQRLDRGGVLIALGGGVVGDLAGFAAASYLRGIDFIQVPTTLLSMVDSSVGGKTGLNLKAGKNLVGAFHQPKAVYVSTGLLATLPQREFAAGMAEVLKYGLLGDEALFARLEALQLHAAHPALPDIVRRCCAIKARIVEADERELAREGGRALLNLGHTFGHAIEAVAGYGTYLHGEAIGVGLCAAAHVSQALGYLSAAEAARIGAAVSACGLPCVLREPLSLSSLVAAMSRDKKVRAGSLRFVVLRALGEAATQEGVDPALASAAFLSVGASHALLS